MNIFKTRLQLLVTLVFAGYVIWWISFQRVVEQLGTSVQYFGYTYGLIALIGAIIGIVAAMKWGGWRTVLGKALMLFSLSLLLQDAGQLIYAYYIVVAKVQIPYPSWGDVAYFGSVLLYISSGVFLARAVGVKFSLKRPAYRVIAIAIPLLLLAASYAILLNHHQYDTSRPLTVFLDAGYPIGEACYISIALLAYLLSRKALGGVIRTGILFIICAFVVQYVADFSFVFQSNRGTYIPGGWDDLLYLISYFVGASAMIQFYRIYAGLRAPTKPADVSTEQSPKMAPAKGN